MVIPQEVVCRIIGSGGAYIKMLNQICGISRVIFKATVANGEVLVISGQIAAVEEVVNLAQLQINRTQVQSSSGSNETQNWKPTRGEQILARRDVHMTAQSSPKPGSFQFDNECDRKRRMKNNPSVEEQHTREKVSNKERNIQKDDFERARLQFDAVKAARMANNR